MLISHYSSIYTKHADSVELSAFLEGVRTGKWQDIVLQVRSTSDKSERDKLKKSAPLVTVSGSFSDRKDDALKEHSGFIAIDIDNIDDPAETKKRIGADPYIYSAFISIGGNEFGIPANVDNGHYAIARFHFRPRRAHPQIPESAEGVAGKEASHSQQ